MSVSRPVARQAASWFMRLQGSASEQERLACKRWREADAEHERAWQLATRFSAHVQAIPAEIARSTLQRPAALSRRSALKALTSLVILGSVGVTLSRSGTLDGLMADASTAVGERRQLTLDDGSQLHLNTNTAVDIRFSASERLLVLRKGELYISTGNDPRPLKVVSAQGYYVPLGTRFALRQQKGHELLSVYEGAVAATSNTGDALHAAAGEQALIDARGVRTLPTAPARADWVGGVLRVERMALQDFVAELGRYRSGWTRCAPELARMQVSGVFQLNDTDAALAALAMAFPVKVRYLSRYWVTLVEK